MQLTVLILATWALGSAAFFGVLGLANGDGRIRRNSDNPIAKDEHGAGRSAVVTRKSPLSPNGMSFSRRKRA